MGPSLPTPGKEAEVLNATSLLEYLIIGSLTPFTAIISADEGKQLSRYSTFPETPGLPVSLCEPLFLHVKQATLPGL